MELEGSLPRSDEPARPYTLNLLREFTVGYKNIPFRTKLERFTEVLNVFLESQHMRSYQQGGPGNYKCKSLTKENNGFQSLLQ
jgi:hypothetical protein